MLRYEQDYLLRKKWFFRLGFSILSVLIVSVLLIQGCSPDARNMGITGNSTEGPRLVLDTDVYDFGTIGPGESKIGLFRLANTGNQTLVIEEVQKCCGAVIDLDKQEIPPGESAQLTAKYSAGLSTISFSRNITLITNDPGNSQKMLTIKGEVVQTLEWSPKSFEIATFKLEEELPDILIKSVDNTPFSIMGFRASNNALSTQFDPQTKATEFTLKPQINTEMFETIGTNSGVISIPLDHPDYESISVTFLIIKPLQVTPAQIIAMRVNKGEELTRYIDLHDNLADEDEDIFERIESIIPTNGLAIEVTQHVDIENGCRIYFNIQTSDNSEDESSNSFMLDELVIKMKDGREINVPVRIYYVEEETETLASNAG